jgi:pyruvate dehydrogenase E1 component alpha subunit
MTIANRNAAPPAAATAPQNGFSLISNDKLLQLYSTMLKCRMIEERIRIHFERIGSGGPYTAARQEAAAAGIGLDLLPGDTLAPSYRGFINCFVKGLPLAALFDRILSRPSLSPARTRAPYAALKLIPPSLSPAVQLQRAVSAATANKVSKNKKLAVAFCGNSHGSSNHLHQAMRRAGAKCLPIIFVCFSGHDAEDNASQAQDYGFPGVTVDSNDAVALYRVATEAIAHARRGSGPTLIECKPWSLSSPELGPRQTAGDPILNMENYLACKGLFTRKLKSAVRSNFQRELDEAARSPLRSVSS